MVNLGFSAENLGVWNNEMVVKIIGWSGTKYQKNIFNNKDKKERTYKEMNKH